MKIGCHLWKRWRICVVHFSTKMSKMTPFLICSKVELDNSNNLMPRRGITGLQAFI